MRTVLLCTLLFAGLASSVCSQQPKEISNSIGMKLILIPAGKFTMGQVTFTKESSKFTKGSGKTTKGSIKQDPTDTPHEVTLTKPYYLGVFEVTQREYENVMGNNPSKFKGAKNPVETVSWDDAVSFCKKLSEMPEEKAAGREYRLPTEAEWEYACRAGSTTLYCFGNSPESLREYAWFGESINTGNYHPVGEKKPNSWGLYDMHGNVFEWCQDWYEPYPSGAVTDPQGPIHGSRRMIRGGGVILNAWECRSAYRLHFVPTDRSLCGGFRVALSPTDNENK